MRTPCPVLVIALTLASLPVPSRAAITPAGVPNFRQVTEHIYRGGQPSFTAWPQLAGLGMKTIVDLRQRTEHPVAAESTAVVAAGMRYVNFPMNGFATPTAAQMAQVLPLLDGSAKVFVHCKLGCDRTGTVVAAYRIARQRWENRRALSEALSSGLHWYEAGMKRFINGYRGERLEAVAGAPVAVEQPALAPDSSGAARQP